MNEGIKLPKWGETMEEGEIGEWFVKMGDRIIKGQTLVSIEIDKANVDLESPVSGTVVSIDSETGDIVPVGSVIAHVQTDELS